jgi:hypothetical protein
VHGSPILEHGRGHHALMEIAQPQDMWLSLFSPILFEPAEKALSDRLRASPSVQPSA